MTRPPSCVEHEPRLCMRAPERFYAIIVIDNPSFATALMSSSLLSLL